MDLFLLIVLFGVPVAVLAALLTGGREGRTQVQVLPGNFLWLWPEEGEVAGESIVLRPVTPETAVAYWATQQGDVSEINGADPDVSDAIGRAVFRPTGFRLFQGAAALHLPDAARTIVGGMTANPLGDNAVELGIWLVPERRGVGLGTEALQLATAHWGSLGREVRLSTHVENYPMLRIAEKVGLERIGTESRVLPNGQEILGVSFRVATNESSFEA